MPAFRNTIKYSNIAIESNQKFTTARLQKIVDFWKYVLSCKPVHYCKQQISAGVSLPKQEKKIIHCFSRRMLEVSIKQTK